VAEEYLIYNFSGILSAVGGALGMFLGWSFYGSACHLLELWRERHNKIGPSLMERKKINRVKC